MKINYPVILLCLATFFSCQKDDPSFKGLYSNWEIYRGTKDANQYSSLQQINRENVKNLEVAWTYHSGGNIAKSTIECNPIVIDGKMYLTSPDLKVISLDAATGKELWKFNPAEENIMANVNRGVTYWEKGQDKRILFTAGYYLFALDAHTGKLIEKFGAKGKVDLRENLGVPIESVSLSVTSPGVIFKDIIILGSAVGEGYNSAPGHVRAYNAITGEAAWIFHTLPQEGEFGAETWPNTHYKNIGGANAWGGLSLDEKRGLVFLATGSPAFDFYGGTRAGENLFGNCIIALDAKNGERVWHYQTVHHDLWDYDLPCAPNLVTIQVNGKAVDAVVQPTKMGYFFMLDRATGEPLYPIEEKPVPTSDIPGEVTYPTQPFPTFPQPYARLGITEEELSQITPEAHVDATKRFKTMKAGGQFIPPSLQGSLAMPGTRGGAEWSGASFDPESGIIYINSNEIANILKLKAVEMAIAGANMDDEGNTTLTGSALGKNLYQMNCASCHGLERQGAPPTYPGLTGLSEKYRQEEVGQLVKTGRGGMPAFAQFSDKQITAISEFLLSEMEDGTTHATYKPETETRFMVDGYNQFLDSNKYPASAPPWGTLNAIDLNSGKLLWKVPVGEYPELTAKGIPPTGTQNMGGCVATAGGLVFVAASKDEKFRAFDKKTGEILWETKLPAGGYATPSIYSVNGKQYIVIAAGGGGKNATKSGDAYVAFALPEF